MKTTGSLHDADDSPSVDVTRRKFLATSAVGVAGLGAVGSAAAAPEKHTLVINGTGPATSYSFTVGGNLEKTSSYGGSINSDDEIIGQSAHGAVGSGTDAYTFTGPLYSFDFDRSGSLDVQLDGEAARVGQRPDHTLLIEGTGSTSSYSFSTSERASKSEAYGASINGEEQINDYGVAGKITSGKDAFTYDGELLSFEFDEDSPVRVTIDGEAANVGERPDRTITVVATGEYADYELDIYGSVREVLDAEGRDTVSRGTISGAVSGTGFDKYTIDGAVRSATHRGDPDIYVNYRNILGR